MYIYIRILFFERTTYMYIKDFLSIYVFFLFIKTTLYSFFSTYNHFMFYFLFFLFFNRGNRLLSSCIFFKVQHNNKIKIKAKSEVFIEYDSRLVCFAFIYIYIYVLPYLGDHPHNIFQLFFILHKNKPKT